MVTLKRILVATDFGEAGDSALAYGRELARGYGATLYIIHVVDDVGARMMTSSALPYDVTAFQQNLDEAAQRMLESLGADNDNGRLHIVTVQRVSTSPAAAIVDYAAEVGIDLIVVGTHGRGAMGHLLMGNVAERVVRTADCPVLTVRHPEHEFIRTDALQVVARA